MFNNNKIKMIKYILPIVFLLSCSKEPRDSRFIYCYKWRESQTHWGCHNFVIEAEDWPSDSTLIHARIDRKIKSQLTDTTLFESKIKFLYNEGRWKTRNLKYD